MLKSTANSFRIARVHSSGALTLPRVRGLCGPRYFKSVSALTPLSACRAILIEGVALSSSISV